MSANEIRDVATHGVNRDVILAVGSEEPDSPGDKYEKAESGGEKFDGKQFSRLAKAGVRLDAVTKGADMAQECLDAGLLPRHVSAQAMKDQDADVVEAALRTKIDAKKSPPDSEAEPGAEGTKPKAKEEKRDRAGGES